VEGGRASLGRQIVRHIAKLMQTKSEGRCGSDNFERDFTDVLAAAERRGRQRIGGESRVALFRGRKQEPGGRRPEKAWFGSLRMI